MPISPNVSDFRKQSASQAGGASWVSLPQQFAVWRQLIHDVGRARACGLKPVLCVDLDLTTLLAPQKSREVLMELAPSAVNFDVQAGSAAGTYSAPLAAMWEGLAPALLPGYTSTSVQAYGIYCAAQLQTRARKEIAAERLVKCEEWIAAEIQTKLRSGYWDRDLLRDELAAGFTKWASMVQSQGGRIVFLSNRDPSLREVSLSCIARLMGEGAPLFAFFGPGGSTFDASSKATAVAMVERGVSEGVHFGIAQNGQTAYPDAVPGAACLQILAVIDDRAENRRQIIEAASKSSERLAEIGLGGIMNIASAAQGFCPEVDVADMVTVVSSFVVEDGV